MTQQYAMFSGVASELEIKPPVVCTGPVDAGDMPADVLKIMKPQGISRVVIYYCHDDDNIERVNVFEKIKHVHRNQIRGGFLWAAPWPCCWRRVLVATNAGFILTNNFSEQEGAGSHSIKIDGTYKDVFTEDELLEHFTKNNWKCLGKAKNITW